MLGMYVVRGRASTIKADRRVLDSLYELVEARDRSVVRVWSPHRQVAFGPRDVRHEAYPTAAEHARRAGYPPVERSVGGHPVAYTGRTLAFARVEPIDDPRRGLNDRYERASSAIEQALKRLGVTVTRGEPPGAFCPGDHSLSASGKLVGIAQRVKATMATTSGVVIVADHEEIATVLKPIYAALDIEFDAASVDSIANAGGPSDPDEIAPVLEDALVDGHAQEVELSALSGAIEGASR